MNTRVKKVIAIVTLAILLSSLSSSTKEENIRYEEILGVEDFCTTYSEGRVFIGSKQYIATVLDDIDYNDIIVIDQRHNRKDPNMKIISSHRITDSKVRAEIVDILLQYEYENPSNWDRSAAAMRREWAVHNFLYDLNYQRSRTKDVDFNNNDEGTYRIK